MATYSSAAAACGVWGVLEVLHGKASNTFRRREQPVDLLRFTAHLVRVTLTMAVTSFLAYCKLYCKDKLTANATHILVLNAASRVLDVTLSRILYARSRTE